MFGPPCIPGTGNELENYTSVRQMALCVTLLFNEIKKNFLIVLTFTVHYGCIVFPLYIQKKRTKLTPK